MAVDARRRAYDKLGEAYARHVDHCTFACGLYAPPYPYCAGGERLVNKLETARLALKSAAADDRRVSE